MTARYGRAAVPADTAPVVCASCGSWPAPQYAAHDRRERLCASCATASDVHADNGGR